MNNKVYTIISDEELEDEEIEMSDLSWDELTLFINPKDKKPNFDSRVLWVVGYGGVAEWFTLGDAQIMMNEIKEYCKPNELPVKAQREFFKACFNE